VGCISQVQREPFTELISPRPDISIGYGSSVGHRMKETLTQHHQFRLQLINCALTTNSRFRQNHRCYGYWLVHVEVESCYLIPSFPAFGLVSTPRGGRLRSDPISRKLCRVPPRLLTALVLDQQQKSAQVFRLSNLYTSQRLWKGVHFATAPESRPLLRNHAHRSDRTCSAHSLLSLPCVG
jgi:hypothetical protein